MLSRDHFLHIASIVAQHGSKRIRIRPYAKLLKAEDDLGFALRSLVSDEGRFEKISRLSKSRLLRQLLDSLFHLDLDSRRFSIHTRKYYTNARQVLHMRVLFMLGARELAVKVARRGLQVAKERQFTENALAFLVELRRNASMQGKHKEHVSMHADYVNQMQLYQAESNAAYYCEKLNIHFGASKAPKKHIANLAKDYAFQVQSDLAMVESRELRVTHFRILSLAQQIDQNYSEAIRTCDHAVEYLKLHSMYTPPLRIGEFLLKKLVCEMLSQQLSEAIETAEQATPYFAQSKNNNLLLQEYRLLVYMQMGKYENARSIYDLQRSSGALKRLSQVGQERWHVYRLYLEFLSDTPESNNLVRKALSPLHLNRYGSALKKDKAGMYFSLVLLHYLQLLRDRNYDQLINQTQSIVAYRNRHLNKPGMSGANQFVNYIQSLAANGFSKKSSDRKLFMLRHQIIDSANTEGTFLGFQILSYSTLVEIVDELIDPAQQII